MKIATVTKYIKIEKNNRAIRFKMSAQLKKQYTFEEFIAQFPDRNSFIDLSVLDNDISQNNPLEFLPNSQQDGTYPTSAKIWEYGLAMFGILSDGRRAIVLLSDIKPYFLIEKPKTENTADQYARANFINEVRSKMNVSPSDLPCEIGWETGKPFTGWQPNETEYLKLSFVKQSSRKKMMTLLRQAGYNTFHDDYDNYYHVVARDYGISLCSWSTISNYRVEKIDQFKQPIFRLSINDYKKYKGEVLKNPTLARDKSIILTWDIECSTMSGNVPNPENTKDKLFMIASTAHWWHTKKALFKICFVELPTDSHNDYITVVCGDEKKLIIAYAYLFDKIKPDFCTGYNSSNFDYPWLVIRAYQHGILEMICDIMNEAKPFNFTSGNMTLGHKLQNMSYDAWSRLESKKKMAKINLNNYLARICPIYCYEKIKIDAETYAEGTQIQTAGCINFDLMTIMRQLYPDSEKNSLDHFLSINNLGGKKDMPVSDLFRIYWETFDAQNTCNEEKLIECKKNMREIAEYCVIDSYRCQELSLMRNVIADKREIASLSYTSLIDAFSRANGMKVRQMVMARGISRGLKFTTFTKTKHEKDKYPGAYVLPPVKGLITSKLTIEERITKHKEYVDKFGYSNPGDGSFRSLPYSDLSTFGSNETANAKIKAFQSSIFEFAQADGSFTIVTDKQEHLDGVINLTKTKESEISQSDVNVFTRFLKDSTGRPITGLDFSSLYPSLIMAYNLSPEYTISLELCNNSISEVQYRVLYAQQQGHKIRRVRFPYGESKREIFGFFISHENQFPTLENGDLNPDCKFGIYPTILKELFDTRNILKVPKEYYQILNEYLDKKNDKTIKTNTIIKLCSSAYPEGLNLDEYKDFNTLISSYSTLKIIKDHPKYGKQSWEDFVTLMKSGSEILQPQVERIELKDAIDVIINKIDFNHAYQPPRRLKDDKNNEQFTPPDSVKKILCAFEDESAINAKGGITWEDIEFYFNYFDSKQKALKVFMNTFYGESGNKLSSMFVLAVAGSITTQGQMNIKMVKEFVETGKIEYEGKTYTQDVGKFSVKYGDTDSLYLAAPEHVFRDIDIQYYSGKITKEQYWSEMVDISFKLIDKIKSDVNSMLKKTCGSKFLKMSYEEVLFPVAFLAKKKYYGIPHISIPNFNPKKLFIKGLEVKKRGVADVLKNLCMDLMWKSMRLYNNKGLLELAYDTIDEFYNKKWDVDLFSQAKQYKPKSEEDIADGKGNKSVIRFVERMAARGIQIKPHERFRTVIIKKYPFEYDYRGRKVPLKIGDFMELVSEAKLHNMEIDIDYYMENGIIGQLARLTIYREEFFTESIDDTEEEIKKADDNSFKRARSHLNDYASKYYKTYHNKGPVYQKTFKLVDKTIKDSYKCHGIENSKINLLCRDWEIDSPETFFKSISDIAEKKAIKESRGYGKKYVTNVTAQGVSLTTLQQLYSGSEAKQMKIVIDSYNSNKILIERNFRNIFNVLAQYISEHRKRINLLSIVVNSAIGIDKLYNEPIKVQGNSSGGQLVPTAVEQPVQINKTGIDVVVFDLNYSAVDQDDQADQDGADQEMKQIIDDIKSKFPEGKLNKIFEHSSSELMNLFNINEIADKLTNIYNDLYNTFLFYNNNLDIQTYLETQLDKKYRVSTTILPNNATREIIDEMIDEGVRNNVIDLEF